MLLSVCRSLLLLRNQTRLLGKTLDEIADYINASGYTHTNNVGEKPKPFKATKQKIDKMLRDPVYTGILKYGKNEITNLIELYGFVPMISVPEFMQINKLSSDAQYIRLAKAYRKAEGVKAHLMNGIIFCSECGESMTAGATSKKTKDGIVRYFYYRCDNDDCPRRGKSLRANVITSYIYKFLASKPFSSKESYDHYVEEMKIVSKNRVNEARQKLLSLQATKIQSNEKLLRTKDLLLHDEPESVKAYYKDDLKRYDEKIKESEVAIAEAEKFIGKNKINIKTYSEFLEIMENMAKTLASIKNMAELDYFIRKVFLNFTVKGKNVEKYTLNAPFDALYELKVSNCGRERT